MRFGITIKPDMSVERIVALARQAEQAGFEYGWIFDSHVLWLEPYPLLTLMAANTKRMLLGTCVTNPAVRDITVTSSLFATLNLISGGRMQLGIGRGDSSRRVLGKKPVTSDHLEESVSSFRKLTRGEMVEYEGRPVQLSWAKGSPPVWIAGYGPKMLHLAGRIAEGVILQFADPDLIAWCVSFVHQGAREAGGQSIGLNIQLPKEQRINPYVTEGMAFHYFFSRKVMLDFSAEAYVFFPGGFGTLDEFFELVTLVQTGKVDSMAPIIIVGSDYWQPLVDWIEKALLAMFHTIAPEDLNIWTLTDDIDEVVRLIEAGVNEQVAQRVATQGREQRTPDDKLRRATRPMSGREQ